MQIKLRSGRRQQFLKIALIRVEEVPYCKWVWILVYGYAG
jgi:hypothetical protein